MIKRQILYWDGSAWIRLSIGSAGQIVKISAGGIPEWGNANADFSCGTSTITDVDRNIYNTVIIGAQCWMKENLRVTQYNDNTSIQYDNTGGSSGSSATWVNLSIGAYSIYANNSGNAAIYGNYYNWYAANGIVIDAGSPSKNICPTGWHVPSKMEFIGLTTLLGGTSIAGGAMKTTGLTYWNTPNTDASNASGFSARGAGYRWSDGNFGGLNDNTYFWCSDEYTSVQGISVELYFQYSSIVFSNPNPNKKSGFPIRCLKD